MESTHNHYSKFLLIWAGEFLSIIGTGLTMFALGVYVYQPTNRRCNVRSQLLDASSALLLSL